MITGNARQLVDHLLSYVNEPDRLFDLKERRKSRSRTQNAYYWAMLNQLARALGMGDMEVHKHMLAEYGVREVVYLREDVPEGDFFEYCDVVGRGLIKGQEFKTVHVYKRSSRMDSGEFSRLIDGMRDECAAQGIPVATPEEIARMEFVEPAQEG